MADLTITEYTTYEEFAREWDAPETDTRMLWQLLGQLDEDEFLIEIPEWLAEENTGTWTERYLRYSLDGLRRKPRRLSGLLIRQTLGR